MEPFEELIGADLVEHGVKHVGVGVSRAISAVQSALTPEMAVYFDTQRQIGINPGKNILAESYKPSFRKTR